MAEEYPGLFDELGNLLVKTKGFSSMFFKNKAFRCSKCFKFYFVPWFLKKHFKKCNGVWQDSGIKEVNKKSSTLQLKTTTSLGYLSKYAQNIDTPMTHEDTIIRLNQTVLVYVEKGKPIGIITFCKRKFKDNQIKYSLDDFFVFDYVQRKGIGKKLFDEMLIKMNLKDKTPAEVEENLLVCSPSNSMISFLNKNNYSLRPWQ